MRTSWALGVLGVFATSALAQGDLPTNDTATGDSYDVETVVNFAEAAACTHMCTVSVIKTVSEIVRDRSHASRFRH